MYAFMQHSCTTVKFNCLCYLVHNVNCHLLLQTSLEFAEDFGSRTDTPLNLVPDYAYFVYDAVWAIALALNSTTEVNDTAAVGRALRDLNFTGVSVSSTKGASTLEAYISVCCFCSYSGSSDVWSSRWNAFAG